TCALPIFVIFHRFIRTAHIAQRLIIQIIFGLIFLGFVKKRNNRTSVFRIKFGTNYLKPDTVFIKRIFFGRFVINLFFVAYKIFVGIEYYPIVVIPIIIGLIGIRFYSSRH